jgi:predicted NUDIX family phosphoesterase
MPSIITPIKSVTQSSHDELILVVKQRHLFPDGAWNGLQPVDMQDYLHLIKMHQEFHPRGLMENDPSYKQIIPYLIFKHKDRYFLMERKAKASEKRLKNKLTLGIGGHIRKDDMQTNSIFDWARREFHEEVDYEGSFAIKPLGILNDDSNEVGKVHVGFVFLLEGDSAEISVKSELKSGKLVNKKECVAAQDRMESWSQLVLEQL